MCIIVTSVQIPVSKALLRLSDLKQSEMASYMKLDPARDSRQKLMYIFPFVMLLATGLWKE